MKVRTVSALVAIVSLAAGMAVGSVVMEPAEATTQVAINKFIRAAGGIPPCKWEDGSGQPGSCYFDAQARSNGKGWSFIAVPDGPDADDDDDIIYLTGPRAVRY